MNDTTTSKLITGSRITTASELDNLAAAAADVGVAGAAEYGVNVARSALYARSPAFRRCSAFGHDRSFELWVDATTGANGVGVVATALSARSVSVTGRVRSVDTVPISQTTTRTLYRVTASLSDLAADDNESIIRKATGLVTTPATAPEFANAIYLRETVSATSAAAAKSRNVNATTTVANAAPYAMGEARITFVQVTLGTFVAQRVLPPGTLNLDQVVIGTGRSRSFYPNCQRAGHIQFCFRNNRVRGHGFHEHLGGRNEVGPCKVSRVWAVEPYPPGPGIHSYEGFGA